jgi:hypothetical protein
MINKKKVFSIVLIFIVLAFISWGGYTIIYRKLAREYTYSNIGTSQLSVSFFTKKPLKSSLLAISLGARPVYLTHEKSLRHYYQIDGLKPGKRYYFIPLVNHFPSPVFIRQRKKVQDISTTTPAAEQVKIKEVNKLFFIPTVKLEKEQDQKSPLIVKGEVESDYPAIVYFSKGGKEEVLSVKTNDYGKFIIDLQKITPLDEMFVTARNGEKQFVSLIEADDLFNKKIKLQL